MKITIEPDLEPEKGKVETTVYERVAICSLVGQTVQPGELGLAMPFTFSHGGELLWQQGLVRMLDLAIADARR